jgi:hypothetical protein
MDVEMGVDTTGHTPRSFYDGHGHPFSKRCEGWHGRSGSERRAVQVVLATRANHPTSETGRAAVNVRLVRPNPPAFPNLLGTTTAAVDPAEHCHCYGGS